MVARAKAPLSNPARFASAHRAPGLTLAGGLDAATAFRATAFWGICPTPGGSPPVAARERVATPGVASRSLRESIAAPGCVLLARLMQLATCATPHEGARNGRFHIRLRRR